MNDNEKRGFKNNYKIVAINKKLVKKKQRNITKTKKDCRAKHKINAENYPIKRL